MGPLYDDSQMRVTCQNRLSVNSRQKSYNPLGLLTISCLRVGHLYTILMIPTIYIVGSCPRYRIPRIHSMPPSQIRE